MTIIMDNFIFMAAAPFVGSPEADFRSILSDHACVGPNDLRK
jgi:hypothetical protein